MFIVISNAAIREKWKTHILHNAFYSGTDESFLFYTEEFVFGIFLI